MIALLVVHLSLFSFLNPLIFTQFKYSSRNIIAIYQYHLSMRSIWLRLKVPSSESVYHKLHQLLLRLLHLEISLFNFQWHLPFDLLPYNAENSKKYFPGITFIFYYPRCSEYVHLYSNWVRVNQVGLQLIDKKVTHAAVNVRCARFSHK
jgi:hypothetical protein